jgi:predicted ATPase
MKKLKKVKIDGFWGEKSVAINFQEEINFLIGPNGSGKTTIINLIAASLKADFTTLDKILFDKIRIDFYEEVPNSKTYIIVEKIENEISPYPEIIFKIKTPELKKAKEYNLGELEEENHFRYPKDYLFHQRRMRSGKVGRDINSALKDIISVTWLSIHRKNKFDSDNENSFESTIDLKIKELSTELTKYFGILDKQYSTETEKFQKNIFLSLIREDKNQSHLETSDLNSEQEKEALKQIFELFGLRESEFKLDLSKHFKAFDSAKKKMEDKKKPNVDLNDFSAIIGTRRIHNIVKEWSSLNQKKKDINQPKFTFIDIINSLLQRKTIFINEKNELLVETQSGKIFHLTNLSSGEKQLIILLGQNLLQENKPHIYIADEPELSLHVDWQERLVDSMRSLNPNSQIVFATHSPDIVGIYSKSIIQAETIIK